MYINDYQTDWKDWLIYYCFCYNTTPSTYHNYTPFELVFGKKAEMPEFEAHIDHIYNVDAYNLEVRYRLQVAHKRAKDYLEKAKNKRKLQYDAKATNQIIKPGDKILVTNENRSKFDNVYKGPYVVKSINDVNCTYENEKGKSMTIHKNRVHLCKQ